MRKKLLFLFGSLFVSLALAELVARVFLPAPQRIVYTTPQANDEAPVRLRARVEEGGLYYTTETGRRLRPNAHVIIENHVLGGRRIEIQTNSLGYRSPEIGSKTSRRRVLFLGDSVTFGDYLHEPETFVRQVEQLSTATKTPLETINAAIGAIGITSELAILKETGLTVEPDVVVLCHYLNDAQPSRMQRAPTLPGWLMFSRLAWHLSRALPNLGLGAKDRARARFDAGFEATMQSELARIYPPGEGDPLRDEAAFHGAIGAAVRDWGSAWSPSAQARIGAALREFTALAAEHHFEFRIVAFPVLLQVQAEQVHDEPQRWLRQLAGELGVPVLDILPVLRRAHRSASEELFYDHCHHTPAGNAIVATEILRFLQQP